MSAVAVLLAGLLPACRAKNALLRLLGGREWSIDPTARIQPVLLWHIGRLRLGAGVYVGPGNIFRDMRRVELDENTEIGQFNWFSAAAQFAAAPEEPLRGSLATGPHALVTSRHYIDCSGGVRIEQAGGFAGVRSTVLTHSINPQSMRQEASPLRVGVSSLLLSNVVVTAGSAVTDNCLVAAGAVVTGHLTVPGRLYGGVPAKEIADISDAAIVGRKRTRNTPRRGLLATVQHTEY